MTYCHENKTLHWNTMLIFSIFLNSYYDEGCETWCFHSDENSRRGLLGYDILTGRLRQHGPSKHWYHTANLHGVTIWNWRQNGPSRHWYHTATLHGVTTWRWRLEYCKKYYVLFIHDYNFLNNVQKSVQRSLHIVWTRAVNCPNVQRVTESLFNYDHTHTHTHTYQRQ